MPFVLAALSTERIMGSFSWARRHAHSVMVGGGALLILLGLLQITGLWLALVSRLQGTIVGWQMPF